MKIVPLDPTLEPIFWEHVNQDLLHYYFFAFNWKYNQNSTRILLAVEGTRIDGMMYIYQKEIVQLRGSCEAIKVLLEHLDLTKIELQAQMQHKPYILAKYTPTVSQEMRLMTLHSGDERLQIKHEVVQLDITEVEQIVTIMREAYPEIWGELTSGQIRESFNSVRWFGIKVKRELVSVGRARLRDWIGHISVVATQENHRNQGFATSIVSKLVQYLFETVSLAKIYVLSKDVPALRVYNKIGFKTYKTYYFMQGEKR